MKQLGAGPNKFLRLPDFLREFAKKGEAISETVPTNSNSSVSEALCCLTPSSLLHTRLLSVEI
jgi:hypothetical protein